MKLALVVSWLNQYGGAERVIEAVHALYPQAPIFTSIHAPAALPGTWKERDIRASWMNRLPEVNRRHQLFLPFYPLAFASLDLRGYDTVLSISSAFAHGVRPEPGARHVCYCLTPARFLWNWRDYTAREEIGRAARAVLPFILSPLRAWDRRAAGRVTEFIGISRLVQQRIQAYYGRGSALIYPPVDVARFSPAADPPGDYFYIQSRLVPYKRIDLAVRALTQLGLPLVIAGDGRDRARLEKMAGPTVRFLGRIDDGAARKWMAGCRAFLFPGDEDFGIAPLEANAAGRPVIAYAGGGALETVVEGRNGRLFSASSVESLARVVQTFDPARFDPRQVRAHAEQFDVRVFQERLRAYLEGSPAAAGPSQDNSPAPFPVLAR